MARKKKARGKKGGDVVLIRRLDDCAKMKAGEWYWERYAANNEYIAGSWAETFKRRIDCVKSAKRAMQPCPIEVEA